MDPFGFGMAFYLMLEALDALKMKYYVHMVKVGKCALLHKKWTFRVELTKKTSHCKSRDFLRKRRLKIGYSVLGLRKPNFETKIIPFENSHCQKM